MIDANTESIAFPFGYFHSEECLMLHETREHAKTCGVNLPPIPKPLTTEERIEKGMPIRPCQFCGDMDVPSRWFDHTGRCCENCAKQREQPPLTSTVHADQHTFKPLEEKPKQISVRIAAVCSVPRLGWQDHYGSIFRALTPHGIHLSWYTTAFWHKGIQQGFNQQLNADWILSLDYDTVFDHIHVQQLLATFGNNPGMDALAAMQPRRGTGAPLMTAKDEAGKKLTVAPANGPIKAYTAHFGFTLFRTAALRDMPKPWFQGVPDVGMW